MRIEVRHGDKTEAIDLATFEERVREGRIGPEVPIRLRAVTGTSFLPAGELELFRDLADNDRAAWRKRWAEAGPPVVTAALVGVQLRVWWLAHQAATQEYVAAMVRHNPPIFEDGESWRLLLSGVVQVSPIHLAGNLMWLAYTGWNLERALGGLTLLRLYTASVIGGGALSMLWYPAMGSYGASGGVMGLVGAAIVFGLLRTDAIPERQRRVFGPALLPYLVLMLASGLSTEGVDNASHLGGLVTGASLAALARPPWRAGPDHAARATWLACAAALGAVALFGPHLVPLQPGRSGGASAEGPAWEVPAAWNPGLTALGEYGATSPAGPRAFAVVEHLTDRMASEADDHATWSAALRRQLPDAVLQPPVAATVGGRPGWSARGDATVNGEPVVLEVAWARQGLWRLTTLWQVDADREARLRPLADRLAAAVAWPEPAPLAEARAAQRGVPGAPGSPDSPDRRRALAEELSRAGQSDEAWPLWEALAREARGPAAGKSWEGLLRALSRAPRPDAGAWIAEALQTSPTPRVVAAASEAARAAGDEAGAIGLLEVAWRRSPADATLRAARARAGLSVGMDGPRPWSATFDPVARARRPVPPDAELTLDAARPIGQSLLDARMALRQRAATEAAARDPALASTLLLLAHGEPQPRPAEAVDALLTSLQAEAAPPWWTDALPPPADLAAAIAAADRDAAVAAVPVP